MLKPTAYRLSPEEIALIDQIRGKLGVSSGADVVRMAVRRLAAAEGVSLPPVPDTTDGAPPVRRRRKAA